MDDAARLDIFESGKSSGNERTQIFDLIRGCNKDQERYLTVQNILLVWKPLIHRE